jgi:glycosyltransferase involved in cell wall biosynthesis
MNCRTIAYFGCPHLGGTYSVYRQLQSGLKKFGWTVRWVGLGPDSRRQASQGEWTAESEFGEVVAPDCADEEEQAAIFLDHLETTGYAAVIINVLANRVQTNAARYLDPRIGRIMVVHGTSPGTYAAAKSIRDHVHATIGVSPRIRDDLVNRLGFSASRTHVIATAFNGAIFDRIERVPHRGALRLLSLGRLEDESKGLFWLPHILSHLGKLPVTLTIAGGGRDEAELRKRLSPFADKVRFIGVVPAEQVAGVMASHDVFLLPSRYEGQAITLVEALAAGCVPVASCLRGVTTFAIDEGKTGLLFPVGDTAAAAGCIERLLRDRVLLLAMSQAGRASALARFQPDAMAAHYSQIIESVMGDPPPIAGCLQRDDWRLPAGLLPGLRTWLPASVKNRLRHVRERWQR